jgi:protease-4
MPVLVLASYAAGPSPSRAATLPVFKLDGILTETPAELAHLLGKSGPKTLYDFVSRMDAAAQDPDVPAVVVLIESPVLGLAQAQELRGAMQGLRRAGKKVHLFAESLTTSTYLLSLGAGNITVVPTGTLYLTGLNPEMMYLRGLLDKIGVLPEIVHIGDYKSAGETLTRTGPSPEAREQTDRLLDDVYDQMIRAVAEARNMSAEQAEIALTSGPYTAEQALEAGLIDAVRYRKDFLERLTGRYEAEPEVHYGARRMPEPDFSTPFGIFQFLTELMQEVKPAVSGASVAVINLEGLIIDGKSNEAGPFGRTTGSRTLRKVLEKAAADESIKAVVLRVNSGGGSALASEIIWKGTQRISRAKPFIVSMGNTAASGGYYVSCGAERIFADSSTITGSIGVLGGKLVTAEMWGKLGINWYQSPRGRHATLFSTSTPFSDQDRQIIRDYMNQVYKAFKDRVSDGRGRRIQGDLEQLAGGRVYTGRQALKIGLVDEIGGLQDALRYAAEAAGLEQYKVLILPEPKSIVDLLTETMGMDDDSDLRVRSWGAAPGNPMLRAAWPLLKNMDPAHRAAVIRSLQTVALLADESVLAVQPLEILFP